MSFFAPRPVCAVALAAAALFATAAHAQAVSLACPAAGASVSTTFYTGNGWTKFQTTATGNPVPPSSAAWTPATVANQDTAWYSALPGQGEWVTPGPLNPPIPSVDPFWFRSPAIHLSAYLQGISTTIDTAVDNDLTGASVQNASVPGTYYPTTASSVTALVPVAGTLPASSDWKPGMANHLLLRVQNTEALHQPGSPLGIYAKVTISGTCSAPDPVAPVPADAPWALLMGAGGIALLARRMAGKAARRAG